MCGLLVVWVHAWRWFPWRDDFHGLWLVILLRPSSWLLNILNQVVSSSAVLRVIKEAVHGEIGSCWVAGLGMSMLLLVHHRHLGFYLLFRDSLVLCTNWVWSNGAHGRSCKTTNCALYFFHLRLDVLLLTATAYVLNVDVFVSVSNCGRVFSLSWLTSIFAVSEKCSEKAFTVICTFPALIQIVHYSFVFSLMFLISLINGIHILRIEVHSILVIPRLMGFESYWLTKITHFGGWLSLFIFGKTWSWSFEF